MALYTYVAAALVGIAAGGLAGWQARDWKADADAAAVRDAAWDAQRRADRQHLEIVGRVDAKDAQRQRAVATAVARDRDELERLRLAAAARDAQDPAPACEPVERQFAECRAALVEGAGLLVEGAGLVRELERQTQGLREYAAGIGKLQLNHGAANQDAPDAPAGAR